MIYSAFANGVIGSSYPVAQSINNRQAREKRPALTVFPMIRTRLLKVLRSKVGKGSTERTGHLGIVDLRKPSIAPQEELRKGLPLTRQTTWYRLGSTVNPEVRSNRDQRRTGGSAIPRRRHEVIKHALQRNTVRLGTVSSSDGLKGIRAWRKARRVVRGQLDRIFGKNVGVSEAISTTGSQDRDDNGVHLLVCD